MLKEASVKKARVMKRDLLVGIWHEHHFGVVIQSNNWGAQIYELDSPFHSGISPEMWVHCEWFPWQSKYQKTELI